MPDETRTSSARVWLMVIALVAVAVLAWWLMSADREETDPVYETEVVDESGGELIVSDPAETGVPVELPETEMTNVPAEQAAGE